jgi:hypothetical protein
MQVDPLKTSAGELDPTLGMLPASGGKVLVSAAEGAGLTGVFTLQLGSQVISGNFQAR